MGICGDRGEMMNLIRDTAGLDDAAVIIVDHQSSHGDPSGTTDHSTSDHRVHGG